MPVRNATLEDLATLGRMDRGFVGCSIDIPRIPTPLPPILFERIDGPCRSATPEEAAAFVAWNGADLADMLTS